MRDEKKERTLEDICLREGTPYFKRPILGHDYCSLKMNTGEVLCSYRNPFMDENGLYKCDFYKYNKIEVKDEYTKND